MDVAAANPNVQAQFTVEQDELAIGAKEQFQQFLEEFREADTVVYALAVQQMRDNDKTTLYVSFQHVRAFSEQLARTIEGHFYRVEPFLRQATRAFVLKLLPDSAVDDKDQLREYFVAFHSLTMLESIRALSTSKIGQLMSIKGTVVRTSAVHPELITGTFQCQDCQAIIPNIEQQFKYTEPMRCTNPSCENRKSFKLILEQSKFLDFQKVRIQEGSDEMPSGSMPRSIDIILRHEAVEKTRAGEKTLFTGTLIVIPDVAQLGGAQLQTKGNNRLNEGYASEGMTGLQQLGVRDLTYKLAFMANLVQPHDLKMGQINVRDENATPASVIAEYTQEERDQIKRMKDDPALYQKLTNSIAPTVYGHDEVKRGILLMLFGGVHKVTKDGMNIRGDINVCIVGDPSTSKSQFLKYIVDFVPRAIYTSGKASTAAGLTAAVVKDEDSNEFFIEAGALMLADNGICCIDEFDKMDVRDQVAIHEAMEQQTISITKAGIQATLNARTSILAAANPVNGRYDRSKSLKANVAMSPPIMSRFDLFFVVVDECNEVSDYHIARHITNVHRFRDAALQPEYSTEQVQRYIRFARSLTPQITPEAKQVMVQQYRKLRQGDASGISKSSYRITVRQLESIVRLSEALARLHCDDFIRPRHVAEACRLLRKSIIHIETEDLTLDDDTLAAAAAMAEEDQQETERRAAGGAGAGGDVQPSSQPPQPGSSSRGDESEADGGVDGGAPSSSSQTPQTKSKKPISISYDKYRRIASLLIRFMRAREEDEGAAGEGTVGDDVSAAVIRKADLIAWYLKEHHGLVQVEQELSDEARVVRLVISRLTNVDNVLLVVGEAPAVEGEDLVEGDSHLLVVHPNYVEEQ